MTTVKYNRRDTTLSVKGHAGYAKAGQDIVCAAVSMLGMTAAAAVQDNAASFFPVISQSKKDNELRIACRPRGGSITSCRRVLDTIFTGYEILSGQYPDYVRTEKED